MTLKQSLIITRKDKLSTPADLKATKMVVDVRTLDGFSRARPVQFY